MKNIFKKGEGEIKKEAGKGLTFSKMFRVKQKEDKKGLTFGGFFAKGLVFAGILMAVWAGDAGEWGGGDV